MHRAWRADDGGYGKNSAFGEQVLGKPGKTTYTAPKYGFGTAERKHVRKVFVSEEHNKALHGIDSPGPLSYKLKSTVGKQDDSRKHNPPQWVFGSMQRFALPWGAFGAPMHTRPGPKAFFNCHCQKKKTADQGPRKKNALGFCVLWSKI